MRVGIDLGTTYSLIAHLNAKGAPTLFPDLHDASAFRTPSVVHAGRGGLLVGDAVETLLRSEPNAPIVRCAKLSMGSDAPLLRANGVDLCPTTVAALVLRKLKRDAEAFANETIESCVVCVPAQSGDAARRATRDAALAAGLPLPKLADEPVAAGVYHGLDRSGEEVLLVYDLGGGTFDATVLRADTEGLHVLATEGDNALGGALMDERIVELLVADLRAAGAPDPRTDPASRERLRRFAEEAKIGLSRPGIDRVEEDLKVGGAVLSFLLTERQLESALAPYIQRTLAVTESCLRAAGVSFERVNRVLLAGGSTFMPAVQRAVQDRCGKLGHELLLKQPHQAVAFGAALLAAREGARGAERVTQTAGHDLCLRVVDRVTGKPALQTLIDRRSPLPASATSTFVTTRPDQARMIFELVQSRGSGDERSLGHFAFGPIRSPRKGKPMELTVGYDDQGLVRARVRDPESAAELEHLMGERELTDAARVARVRENLDRLG